MDNNSILFVNNILLYCVDRPSMKRVREDYIGAEVYCKYFIARAPKLLLTLSLLLILF